MINTKERVKELEHNADDSTMDLVDIVFDQYSGNISDSISEYADSNVDIYNSDLLDWAKDHLGDIEEANQELGMPEDGDIIKQIMQAQFLVNERELLDSIKEGVVLKAWKVASEYKESVTDEQAQELDDMDTVIDANNYIDDITDQVKEILGIED